jgi:hypothetical protein
MQDLLDFYQPFISLLDSPKIEKKEQGNLLSIQVGEVTFQCWRFILPSQNLTTNKLQYVIKPVHSDQLDKPLLNLNLRANKLKLFDKKFDEKMVLQAALFTFRYYAELVEKEEISVEEATAKFLSLWNENSQNPILDLIRKELNWKNFLYLRGGGGGVPTAKGEEDYTF